MGVIALAGYVANMTIFFDVRYAGTVFPVVGWWLYDVFYITPFLAIPYLHSVNREMFRSEEHTSELQSLMRISYAVFCLKKKPSEHTSLMRISTAVFLLKQKNQKSITHYKYRKIETRHTH